MLTYQVLCSWQTVAGSQSSLEMFSESLTAGILIDIKYNKPSLNLIVCKKALILCMVLYFHIVKMFPILNCSF